MHFGPHTVLLAMELKFRAGLSLKQIEATVDGLETKVRSARPEIKHVFIEIESLKEKRSESTGPEKLTRKNSEQRLTGKDKSRSSEL